MVSKSSKTKAVLEEEVGMLKKMVKELKGALKDVAHAASDDLGERPYTALGLFKDEEGDYRMAEIEYNPENGACKLISQDYASRVPKSPDLAKFHLEEVSMEKILKRLEEHYV